MKIECVQAKLSEFLKKAERISSKNATLPILSTILLEVKGSELFIRSTNLELGVEFSIPVKVQTPGTVAVSAQVFTNYISSLQSKNVTLQSEGNSLIVESHKQRAVFNTFDHNEFPTIPRVVGTSTLVSSKKFRSGIRSVVFSASVSSIKPELSSVFISGDTNGNLVFVATDSFRLAEKKVDEKSVKDFDPVLIPYKNILEIERVLEGVDADVEIVFGDSQISVLHENTYITSRVVDGQFPDYKKILPKSHTTRVIALTSELMGALKTAAIFSDKFNKISLVVQPQNNLFSVETRSGEIGESKTDLDAKIEGEPLTAHFNYRYIADVFQVINTDSIEFLFNGATQPLLIKGTSSKDFVYIVMPMNK
jgi:DNA polymerase-3 subunit beta